MTKEKVVVGMSGGVDSSVAAYLLKEQGYDVIGVTMKIWDNPGFNDIEHPGGCCGLSAVDDARRVAEELDIPYYVMNFKNEFKTNVIDYFINEYKKGRTPNPCIACNRYVKWESLLYRSRQIGACYIATGHYARVGLHPETKRHCLRVSATENKDQTYALYNLTQEQLSRTLMPVGNYTKEQIRGIASSIGFRVANKPDSQEICFIPDNNYGGFLEKHMDEKPSPGDFVDLKGKILGRHKGIMYYTVGQRKGLGIAFGKPMYVYAINKEENSITLCENDELFRKTLYAGDLNFMSVEDIEGEVRVLAKIRYSHKKATCTIRIKNSGVLECVFDEHQRAITPGQAVVFYDGEYVLGGGTIL